MNANFGSGSTSTKAKDRYFSKAFNNQKSQTVLDTQRNDEEEDEFLYEEDV